jgi:hypothetical protein
VAVYDEWNQVVTAILKEVHQLDPDIYDPDDLDIHRDQITSNGNRVIRYMWGLRDWTFKYIRDADIVVPANAHESNDLPADWVNEGRQGGLWTNFDPRYQVKWARAGAVRNMIASAPDETGAPRWYSVIGLRKLIIFPKNAAEQAFKADYEMQAPTLDAPGDVGDVGNLDALPYQWRHVLYEGTAAREYRDAGDLGQSAVSSEDFKTGLFDMICGEAQGKPGAEIMPPYAGAPVETDWMDW